MVKADDPNSSHPPLESFASILVADVGAALRRFDSDQSQQVRRDMIRTLFAAIEGYAWLYRERVIDTARSMDLLTREEGAALSEVSYHVSDKGKITSQPRFLSTLAAFRLTTGIASKLNSNLTIRFDTEDWERLRSAISIRNRITHPKRRSDLEISDHDLMAAQSAFFWLLETAIGAMEAANAALRRYNDEFRAALIELQNGNPTLWAEYREAIAKSWSD